MTSEFDGALLHVIVTLVVELADWRAVIAVV